MLCTLSWVFCLFTLSHYVNLADLKLTDRPGWSQTQSSACLCLPSATIPESVLLILNTLPLTQANLKLVIYRRWFKAPILCHFQHVGITDKSHTPWFTFYRGVKSSASCMLGQALKQLNYITPTLYIFIVL